ncbi:DUF58 domain-containing protein [Eubacteriales bacterium OttesenSCG-928-N13]|nr:DUF58 domain-containing protein [Eubacteriales bacterium OttesenSCG-928-N13]
MRMRLPVFLLCFVTLLIVALSTGASIYYLLLLVMLMMLVTSVISVVLAVMTVKISMDTPRRKLSRGASALLSVRVKYFGLLPTRSFQLVLSVPEDVNAQQSIEVALMPFKEKQFQYEMSCPHRGLYHVGVVGVKVTDIFQLISLKRKISGNQVLLEVRPNVTRIRPIELSSGDSEPTVITRTTEDTASPSDVRNYQLGDPLKKIHWKLSIRKRELLVRNYEESSRPDTLILVDLSPINSMRSQALTMQDVICETAASIAHAQLSNNYPVRMPLMSAHPQEASGQNELSFPRFLDALMRTEFDSPYPFEQVLTLEMRRMQRTGGAVLVTARLTPRIADIAQQLRRYGMQVSLYWITETRRAEALEMMERLSILGIRTHRVDPWDKGLNEANAAQ